MEILRADAARPPGRPRVSTSVHGLIRSFDIAMLVLTALIWIAVQPDLHQEALRPYPAWTISCQQKISIAC